MCGTCLNILLADGFWPLAKLRGIIMSDRYKLPDKKKGKYKAKRKEQAKKWIERIKQDLEASY